MLRICEHTGRLRPCLGFFFFVFVAQTPIFWICYALDIVIGITRGCECTAQIRFHAILATDMFHPNGSWELKVQSVFSSRKVLVDQFFRFQPKPAIHRMLSPTNRPAYSKCIRFQPISGCKPTYSIGYWTKILVGLLYWFSTSSKQQVSQFSIIYETFYATEYGKFDEVLVNCQNLCDAFRLLSAKVEKNLLNMIESTLE